MAKLFNRAKMTTSTTGTGTITLGSASTGFQTFADAGVSDGDVVQYVIEEGANFEIGTGTYTASGTTLSRTPSESSNSDAAITLAGAAQVAITAVASQIGGGDRDLSFDDNAKAKFGASDDLQIFHDGTHTYIDETNPTGYLFIRGANTQLLNPSNEIYLECNNNGSVDLYHDNSKKLATTSTGISVTGNATFADNGKAIFGAGSDLQIYHDGSASYITENGAGSLFISGTNMWLKSSGGDTYILCNDTTDTVSLYQANSKKLETTSTGVDISGSITADGLGIGVSSPAYTIDASSSGDTQIHLKASGQADGLEIGQLSADGGSAITATNNNYLKFGTNNTERMRIDSSGRVGIGTSTPSEQLTNYHATNSKILASTGANGASQIYFGDNSSDLVGRIYYDHTADSMRFHVNTAERMRIDSSGNVMVGTTSSFGSSGITLGSNVVYAAASSQNVANFQRYTTDGEIVRFGKDGTTVGSIGSTAGTHLYVGSGDTGLLYQGGADAIEPWNPSTNSARDDTIDLGLTSNRFRKAYLGQNVFVRTTSLGGFVSSAAIQSNGGTGHGAAFQTDATSGFAAACFSRNSNNGAVQEFFYNVSSSAVGTISITSSQTTYNTTSDRRLKTDIQPIAHATDMLMAMNPVTHKWKAEPDADAVVGFIAQEMQEVVPEAVTGDPDGDEMMAMDYGRITPVLVAALQDAHKKIEALEARLSELEAN